jgi:hypothetical protein
MAIINKTGITTGGTIDAEHITRAIDALSGQSAASIVATGSFNGDVTGSFLGTASYASLANRINVSDNTNGANEVYPVFVSSTGSNQVLTADSVTFKYIPVGNLIMATASLARTASLAFTASVANTINQLPAIVPTNPAIGSLYLDTSNPGMLWVYDGTDWYNFQGTIGTP